MSLQRALPERATKEERALVLFTLMNPMHEDACCALGLRGLLDKVLFRKNTEDDPRQAPVLRAAMRFLSATRSAGEHAALRERLTRRDCKQSSRISHRRVSRPLTEILELILLDLCGTMSDYFMRLGPGKFRKEKNNLPQNAQPWPSRISDVIPTSGGETELLIALVNWAATVPGGHSVFALIGALARFWEPFAMQLFQSPDVFRLATQHLRHALDSFKTDVTAAEAMNAFISPVIACAQGLFFAIFEVNMLATIGLLPPIFEEMYAISVSMEPILLDMRNQNRFSFSMDDCRRWFAFVRRMRPIISPDGTFITLDQASQIPRKTDGNTHYVGAYMLMTEIRNRNQCMHINCTSKITARSSVCSGCQIVRYCDPKCLRAAWTAPELPHKPLCKHIKNLREATGLVDDKAWNHMVRDTAIHRSPEGFVKICAARDVDRGIVEAIFTGISRLTHAKMGFGMKESQVGEAKIGPAAFTNAEEASQNGDEAATSEQ
ncbi:hypothetical protein C8R44DRAFT_769280 [Mycena epipterygia]|nr:hypothetical protein C8R44DRAFT_769280 [Mycena epipterygia]